MGSKKKKGEKNAGKTSSPKKNGTAQNSGKKPKASAALTSDLQPFAGKLMHRFYEPLVLLHVLSRNSDQRITRYPSEEKVIPQSRTELRRDFLDQLAYICDYLKGGETVTAVGLEWEPSMLTYWVTSNNGLSAKVTAFLQEILKTLQRLALSPTVQTAAREATREAVEDYIAVISIEFNLKRIKEYQSLMKINFQKSLLVLGRSNDPKDKALVDWLTEFLAFGHDLHGLCKFAYQQRASDCMKDLHKKHIRDKDSPTSSESNIHDFTQTRHYIGRLGSHLRAAKILSKAACEIPSLFDEFKIALLPRSPVTTMSPPLRRATTLNGIVNRIFSNAPEDVQRYQDSLATMDVKFGILPKLQEVYQDKSSGFKPRVHAETHVLEFFHTKRLKFLNDDKYIGCSKPACYCCYHYIRLHKGNFILPASHGVRYLSWRPPDLPEQADDNQRQQQKVLINALTEQIRNDALTQIDKCGGPNPYHPDSTAGLTASMEGNLLHEDMESLVIDGDTNSMLGDSTSEDEDGESGGCALEC